MKRYLPLSALALAGVLAFGPTTQARDRAAEDLNAPLILRSPMDPPAKVARRGNQIFIYNQGDGVEHVTLVTKGPAVISEMPLREGKRAKIVTQRMMAEPIAEGPSGEVTRARLLTTRARFHTSSDSPDVLVEGPVKTTVITTSQPEAIAEGPSTGAAESTTFEVRKAGGFFTPDGLTLSGRGLSLWED